MTLNRNNDDYYQTYMVPLEKLPVRGFRATEHSLRKAFEWFDKRIADHVAKPAEDAGIALAQFIDSVADKLFFTVITVTDELNAFKVFETLNARGVRLSSTDLLKNYLFSVLHREGQHENEMKNLENRWESIVGRLGSESFPDFLRTHWNSRNPFVRQAELFKRIRSRMQDRKDVFGLIRNMEEDVDTYMALTQPDVSEWPEDAKRYARQLRMFSVKQPFALLFSARRVLNDQDFISILRTCAVIFFRYNVIGNLPSNEQERVYNQVASRVSSGELSSSTEIIQALGSIYPKDREFKAVFTEKSIRTTQSRNKRIVRYILCRLEKQLANKDYDFDSTSFNIEHILPENPGEGWDAFSENELDFMTYRLGNMTLLESGPNRDIGNKPYDEKKTIFDQSAFEITQKISQENADWNSERITARQSWMANHASSIWRVDALS